ncbi:Lysozyme RrrD [Sodalis glossinidius str. 'morsitans']|uniref:Lysozyme n=1 Tax=Sodalis glossinidius (strain morsitans) TaxID=343509 RepID=A0A193QG58_SODGM|nr:glycoside hydrolase family protein [Sodalis glossinidius]CRL44159.1 Lysozyme RrrD [Sodalis glossinidius str. 'morsitans']CRL46125.1 Lysozyme RrrD [Sodalis glossinidius str. 'morsitans']
MLDRQLKKAAESTPASKTTKRTPAGRKRAAECRALLERDWATFSRVVDRAVSVPMSDYQRAVLVSFSYNVGAAAFEHWCIFRGRLLRTPPASEDA